MRAFAAATLIFRTAATSLQRSFIHTVKPPFWPFTSLDEMVDITGIRTPNNQHRKVNCSLKNKYGGATLY